MDLDDILNDALDEVTRDEEPALVSAASSSGDQSGKNDVQSALSNAAATTAKTQLESAQAAASAEVTGEEGELANLLKMFGSGSDFEKVLDDAFKDLDLNDIMSKLGVSGEPGKEDEEMKKLMEMLAGGGAAPGAAAAGGAGGDPSKMLEEIASKLESSVGGDQMDKMLESMMKSFMSKDMMYEPITRICAEFPKYLTKKNIPAEDRSRFEAQLSAYQALKKTFEEDENNMDQVMRIIQDLERFGQPPDEIQKLLGAGGPGGPLPGAMPNPNQCPTQ